MCIAAVISQQLHSKEKVFIQEKIKRHPAEFNIGLNRQPDVFFVSVSCVFLFCYVNSCSKRNCICNPVYILWMKSYAAV